MSFVCSREQALAIPELIFADSLSVMCINFFLGTGCLHAVTL